MSSKTKYHYPDGSVTFDPTLIITGTGTPSRIEQLERENAALRADKERLDWLLTGDGGFWVNWMYEKDEWTPELKASRDAIDACRNGRIGREKP